MAYFDFQPGGPAREPEGDSGPPFQLLLKALRAGDETAREALFERFYPTVEGMVHRALARDIRAKRPWIAALFSTGDVVQEVFHSVLGDLQSGEFQSEDALTGYLAMVVRNRLIDSIRHHEAARRDGRRAMGLTPSIDPLSERPGPVSEATSAEDLLLLDEALQEFPERVRLLLRERLESEETFPVLAERLSYPSADAARKAFYAAQAQLLLKLERKGLGPDEVKE